MFKNVKMNMLVLEKCSNRMNNRNGNVISGVKFQSQNELIDNCLTILKFILTSGER